MQKWVSKIQVILLVGVGLCPAMLYANQSLLQQADSLFNQKKFSEAREVYYQLYQQGYSSPATLLKMAFVHEGLSETGQALYFLSAYYRETEDQKAYEKILTLANARGLSGYELSEWDRLSIWATNRIVIYQPILIVTAVFFLAVMIYNVKRSNVNGKFASGFVCLLFLGLSFTGINLLQPSNKAIVTTESYLMSGPSSAASLLSLIPEGNQVKLSGESDIWIAVEWNDQKGYIRKEDLIKTR